MPARAALATDSTLYVAHHDRLPGEPSSAIVRLIQGIWECHPEMAQRILRSRVYFDTPLTALDSGIIRVAAKRSLFLSPTEFDGWISTQASLPKINLSPVLPALGLGPLDSPFLNDASWLSLTRELALTIPQNGRRFENDRNVAAILVSPEGRELGRAVNANHTNRTLHAEVRLLQTHFLTHSEPLTPGTKLYVSLKPCRMCAGMIWDCSEDPAAIQVLYAENDPGPFAQGTMLDADSAERKRFAPPTLWGLQLANLPK